MCVSVCMREITREEGRKEGERSERGGLHNRQYLKFASIY